MTEPLLSEDDQKKLFKLSIFVQGTGRKCSNQRATHTDLIKIQVELNDALKVVQEMVGDTLNSVARCGRCNERLESIRWNCCERHHEIVGDVCGDCYFTLHPDAPEKI